MDSQDGITVRPMRLKVLYTFDNENKTNCLARWPNVLDIQTAYLDEQTPVGVIELKTCIQAIVSASPELVAQLGKDYTVYAYDYSEYETPLVGQGMLSWVLASASPTPDAPAHQSKTMVTGRVCKNPQGLFSRGAGAQETLEVKLRLVPVPTVMQSEYLDSMQKYRELSNVIPHDFDAQTWSNFVRQNPALLEAARQNDQNSSPVTQSGIERFHQLLSEGATPREFSNYHSESVRSSSPTHSFGPPSRMSTPAGSRPSAQHQQSQSKHNFGQSDMIRPSSSASMQDIDFQHQSFSGRPRRDSMQSGYGSGADDVAEPQPRKRAKLVQAGWPGKSDMNIERQPSSLRVMASTAASVRIHRPTPVNPALAVEQSHEEPVRPPTPISRPGDMQRRGRLQSSLLRESSTNSVSSYASPYYNSDDIVATDQSAQSPDDSRYQGLFEPGFNMPSSPPILDGHRFAQRSSPVLPAMSLDTDSGFLSGGFDDLLDDGAPTPVEEGQRIESREVPSEKRSRPVRSAVQANSPASAIGLMSENANDSIVMNDGLAEQSCSKPPTRPTTSAESRPSSRAGVRLAPKPLAPAPISHTELVHLMNAIPASDPIAPSQPPSLHHSHTWNGPMSDFTFVETPRPPTAISKPRSGTGAKRSKQVQVRLEQAVKAGEVPPYCENCGSVETPTWRRAWSMEVCGSEQLATEMMNGLNMLFWEVQERNDQGEVTRFKIVKKSLANADKGWTQDLLCNPCGLWLHKFKQMRPENKWNKQPADKTGSNTKKRSSRNRKQSGGPLSKPSTRARSNGPPTSTAASSPAPTEASSVQNEEGTTPQAVNDRDYSGDHPNKKRRANSAEPLQSSETAKQRWADQDAVEALRRAIQSSPARNLEKRIAPTPEDTTHLTPKPVRRALFPSSHNDGALKDLDASFVNSCSPRRSPRIASRGEKAAHEDKENSEPTPHDDIDGLFESPSMDFDMPISPTPRRRNHRINAVHERRHSLPGHSPTANRRKEIRSNMNQSPTRLTAERLQRIQEGHGRTTPRQHRSPNKHGGPTLVNAGLHSEAFQSLDGMILDIFDEAPDQSDFDLEDAKLDENWADWLPNDYVSPSGSEEGPGPSGDLMNAILSDSTVMKDNMHDSQYHLFNFGDSEMPDSGFFSSDALNTDPIGRASKSQPASEQSHGQQATSPTA
ncbi:uncharacterized protein N7477_003720 [Penicillium maclennaniae]|uniref:uncharacterized protein n=1 Tax=Penicillium maclennaniae TaxID=1343394 RepID=UPI002542481D|nr:uncharacterized protein N7477_003720 [Penicillium maclennaniae]KAJ5678087.1 hypothetical protein N7477_003720 [Penicillium maclennaniae]